MGYVLEQDGINKLLLALKEDYLIYAPKIFEKGGRFSDTDCVRYSEISKVSEIVFDRKSEFSFKEILMPVSETLFYFTEDSVKESDCRKKGAIVFLRSCDLHAVKRLDEMYLDNGPEDHYYKRLREKVKFVLIGCKNSFDSCFCASMGTNISEDYDLSIDRMDEAYAIDSKWDEIEDLIKGCCVKEMEVEPYHVMENNLKVTVPENLDDRIIKSSMWNEYDSRCISCGCCNFVCPTCTCYTMQDLYYDSNKKVGERRRVWASCMVDGYTDVAGGGSYRKKNGERMRFKVLHKVYHHKKRTGHHMCVGCGRCDDICPEYISYSNCINKLEEGMKEVSCNE